MKKYCYSGEKIVFFQKGLTHDFSQKLEIFANWFFLSKGLKYDNDVLARYTTKMPRLKILVKN